MRLKLARLQPSPVCRLFTATQSSGAIWKAKNTSANGSRQSAASQRPRRAAVDAFMGLAGLAHFDDHVLLPELRQGAGGLFPGLRITDRLHVGVLLVGQQ